MRKRAISGIIAAIMVLTLLSTVAYAATMTYALSNATSSWTQSTSNWTSTILDIDSANDQITFEGVATGSNTSTDPKNKRTFQVELQKTGFFGWGPAGGNVYTVEQHARRTYNSRTKQYVAGQYFKLIWLTNVSDDRYRVVLKNQSHSEVVGLTNMYFYGTDF